MISPSGIKVSLSSLVAGLKAVLDNQKFFYIRQFNRQRLESKRRRQEVKGIKRLAMVVLAVALVTVSRAEAKTNSISSSLEPENQVPVLGLIPAPMQVAGGEVGREVPVVSPVEVREAKPAGGVPPPEAVAPCPCCGEAFGAPNQTEGEVWGRIPIGGVSESCWVVLQVWWREDGSPKRLFAGIRPGSVLEIEGILGGKGWYFAADNDGVVWDNLRQQEADVIERERLLAEAEGREPEVIDTWIQIFPDALSGPIPSIVVTAVN